MNESEKIDPRELSPLALAFVGDSVLELLVRQRLVEHHRLSAGKLNAEKVKYVSAKAQFREEQLLEPLFTEDELAVFKRGRNASKASVAKHASPEEYRASTGFECLLGWLYLNGQLERVHQLFEVLWQKEDATSMLPALALNVAANGRDRLRPLPARRPPRCMHRNRPRRSPLWCRCGAYPRAASRAACDAGRHWSTQPMTRSAENAESCLMTP